MRKALFVFHKFHRDVSCSLTGIYFTFFTLFTLLRKKPWSKCFPTMEEHRKTNMIEYWIEIVDMILANYS